MNAETLNRLATELPGGLIEPAEPQYREELRKSMAGAATHVAHPRSREDVQAIVRGCHDMGVAIIPFGGWTGLVGGQLSGDPNALLVSMKKLNAIRGIYPEEGAMTVEAGMVLANVHAIANQHGMQFPLTLGAYGTAQIGGLLSTNAGGTSVLRYGAMRDLVMGIEAVLPDGSLMDTAHRLHKSNMGYDLRHLLIGAEGTLGIITAATLKLMPQPKNHLTAFLKVESPAAALDLLARARAALGDEVTGCELIDGQGLHWLAQHYPDVRQPFETIPTWSVLLDVASASDHGQEQFEAFVTDAFETELVSDGLLASSQAQREQFWHVREMIPEASRKVGPIASHDVSVPLSEVGALIDLGRKELTAIAPDIRFNTFGHVGDGNVHFNIFPAKGKTRDNYANLKVKCTQRLHDLVAQLGGAISAEHGIGRFKAGELQRLHDPAAYAAMRAIKQALDPKGIMNPGAIFA